MDIGCHFFNISRKLTLSESFIYSSLSRESYNYIATHLLYKSSLLCDAKLNQARKSS